MTLWMCFRCAALFDRFETPCPLCGGRVIQTTAELVEDSGFTVGAMLRATAAARPKS